MSRCHRWRSIWRCFFLITTSNKKRIRRRFTEQRSLWALFQQLRLTLPGGGIHCYCGVSKYPFARVQCEWVLFKTKNRVTSFEQWRAPKQWKLSLTLHLPLSPSYLVLSLSLSLSTLSRSLVLNRFSSLSLSPPRWHFTSNNDTYTKMK